MLLMESVSYICIPCFRCPLFDEDKTLPVDLYFANSHGTAAAAMINMVNETIT